VEIPDVEVADLRAFWGREAEERPCGHFPGTTGAWGDGEVLGSEEVIGGEGAEFLV
jgi:hypothetical protein